MEMEDILLRHEQQCWTVFPMFFHNQSTLAAHNNSQQRASENIRLECKMSRDRNFHKRSNGSEFACPISAGDKRRNACNVRITAPLSMQTSSGESRRHR
jgi:hypothetical protein